MDTQDVFRALQNAGRWSSTKVAVGLFLFLFALGITDTYPTVGGLLFLFSGLMIGETMGVDCTRLEFAKTILGEQEYTRRLNDYYSKIY